MSLGKLLADAKDEFSSEPATAAKGTRELNRDGRFFGLALVVPGHPETVTENLQPGTYWLGDVANAIGAGKPAQLVRLTVRPFGRSGFRGTRMLLCFVADDMTGIPHAIMGMHLVIHLV